jgi:hypothetical protein
MIVDFVGGDAVAALQEGLAEETEAESEEEQDVS